MTLQNLGSNQTQISKSNGDRILYSYNTPVAAYIVGRGYVKAMRFYSVTTSKHINKWLGGASAEVIDTEDFETLVQ
jgi:hypothetical protein